MYMSDEDLRDAMYEIDRILGNLWVNGLIGSDIRRKVLEQFPPRLKDLVL